MLGRFVQLSCCEETGIKKKDDRCLCIDQAALMLSCATATVIMEINSILISVVAAWLKESDLE